MPVQLENAPVVHVRFEGRSLDLPFANLDLRADPTSDEVKRAVATSLEVPLGRLRDYVVDRHETGNVTVRPHAVYG